MDNIQNCDSLRLYVHEYIKSYVYISVHLYTSIQYVWIFHTWIVVTNQTDICAILWWKYVGNHPLSWFFLSQSSGDSGSLFGWCNQVRTSYSWRRKQLRCPKRCAWNTSRQRTMPKTIATLTSRYPVICSVILLVISRWLTSHWRHPPVIQRTLQDLLCKVTQMEQHVSDIKQNMLR
jgi:hypothetical protein